MMMIMNDMPTLVTTLLPFKQGAHMYFLVVAVVLIILLVIEKKLWVLNSMVTPITCLIIIPVERS